MRGGGHEKNHMLFGGWSLLFFWGGLNLDSRKFVFNLTLGWGMMR